MRVIVAVAGVALAACAPLQTDRMLGEARDASGISEPIRATRTEADALALREEVDELLAKPVGMDAAVRIALAITPAFQEVLFRARMASAQATQAGRLSNPLLTFERLVRTEHGEREIDIGRMLSVPLLELVLLPTRQRAVEARQRQLQLELSRAIVAAAANTRQAWIRAVAAAQAATYAEQVKASADASAELARRMQGAGNFSRLQRAREQAFYADATAQLARARLASIAAREALVRSLGLDADRADKLTLPDRLPDLPAQPRAEQTTLATALEQRLDVRMAGAELEHLQRQHGLTRISPYVDGLHLAAVRNSETGRAPQKGFEVELRLPIFDFGEARRAEAEAAYMAAVHRVAAVGLDAASQVREGYAGYRTAYEVARHYRDEVVPLRKAIADEMLLKYNGMLIGVFELLADSREQIGSVIQAIEAQRDFWLADAALQATLIGSPLGVASLESKPTAAPRAAEH